MEVEREAGTNLKTGNLKPEEGKAESEKAETG